MGTDGGTERRERTRTRRTDENRGEREDMGEYRMLLLPDHPTPLALRTHTSEPVPFIIYSPSSMQSSLFAAAGINPGNTAATSYNEVEAEKSGIFIEPGHSLMDLFING